MTTGAPKGRRDLDHSPARRPRCAPPSYSCFESRTHCAEPSPRARLQRKVFHWFGFTILLTGLVVGAIVAALSPSPSRYREDIRSLETFAARRFAAVWHDQTGRDALLREVAGTFRARVTLESAEGQVLSTVGPRCQNGYVLEIRKNGALLGRVLGCRESRGRHGFFFAALGGGVLMVWFASAFVARRLMRPLNELERVTREIGAGNLSARVRLGRQHAGEVGSLADSVNEMARRIERQLQEERTLLAAVSHELRSPLARVRLLVELARSAPDSETRLSEIESELEGIDALIGKLLASSRLEFGAIHRTALFPADVAKRALAAANLPESLLQVEHSEHNSPALSADAALLGRALGNLLENAQRHGGGAVQLRVTEDERGECPTVRFEVFDSGPGFGDAELERVFQPFVSGNARAEGSLGLGLALVSRIAKAHSGRAFATNLVEGGARVVIEMPLLAT